MRINLQVNLQDGFSFRKLVTKPFLMNLVKDILSRKARTPITVLPGTTVFDALKVMAENNIGSVMVTENEAILGIITERDYSRKIALKGKSSTGTTVSEIMTTDFTRVKPEDTVEQCMLLMTDTNTRYLPVFENDQLKGIISISDVIKQMILIQQQTITHLDNYIHS